MTWYTRTAVRKNWMTVPRDKNGQWVAEGFDDEGRTVMRHGLRAVFAHVGIPIVEAVMGVLDTTEDREDAVAPSKQWLDDHPEHKGEGVTRGIARLFHRANWAAERGFGKALDFLDADESFRGGP